MVLQKIARVFGGNPHKKEVENLSLVVDDINKFETPYEALSNDELLDKTVEFRERFDNGETLDDLLPEAFAAVREASKRTIGLRHYDIQMIGGMTLHSGKIAEMRTGEGKTLVATLPVYLNALTRRGVHVVTVNDYLSRRDARWMFPIYKALGLSVGVLQMADRTENGKKAFLLDLDKPNAREDLHQLALVDRVEAYKADIVYGTNSEFGFDYLRDNLTMSMVERVQRGHYYAIVDEVDNILIDEARTPLIISGPAADNAAGYQQMVQVVRALAPEDYEVNEKDNQVSLTETGEVHVSEILGEPLRDLDRPEDINPRQAQLQGFLEQALRAQHLYRRNKDYIVQGGKVVIVDEFTGRLMPGRRWSEGLHQAVEAKEGVKIEPENMTYATITIQNYFRMYEKLAGMTGTALTEAEEFSKIYKLEVLPIPMNLEYVASRDNSPLTIVDSKDEEKYSVQYYARRDDIEKQPIFWRRQDFPDMVYRSEEGKIRAITREVLHYYAIGRPQLIGTTSVEHSERLSLRLGAEPLRRLVQTLIIRDAWMEKFDKSYEQEIAELQFLNRPLPELNIGDMRPFARQAGLNSTNPEDPENLKRLLTILKLDDSHAQRVITSFQGGIPHQVLNARKHDEESQIIARAGAFGAVTIATNMAGRGVDIKLGGELSEEVIADVIRVLERVHQPDPYGMSNDARLQILKTLDEDQIGIYEESVKTFFEHFENMARVRELGGLHVIGSERHEARRIDNQLRGRAARQGDPGSSRFYLSLEDELMRLFGGVQMESLMGRLKVDPSLPIESGLLGRMVEQAQERVEGNNFDVRKHLLEYDDVLNAQRNRIYSERDRAFSKIDLHDDVIELLRTELQERIPKALDDEEGPWKLLSYLEQVQPTMVFEQESVHSPSYTLHLLENEILDQVGEKASIDEIKEVLLKTAKNTLEAETDHLLKSARSLLEKTENTAQQVTSDRLDALDTYFEGLGMGSGEEGQPARRSQEILEEIIGLLGTPLRLSSEDMRKLPDGDEDVKNTIADQVKKTVKSLAITRTINAIEMRLDESLNMRPVQLIDLDWDEINDGLFRAVEGILDTRADNLLADNGLVSQNIDNAFSRSQNPDGDLSDRVTDLLIAMSSGTRMAIDPRTHQKVMRNVRILNYIFLAARMIQDTPVREITADILEHLEGTRQDLEIVWGKIEFDRFRLAGVPLMQLEGKIKESLREAFGPEVLSTIEPQHPEELTTDQQDILTVTLGTRVQNEIYRHILVSVFSEHWVEYLTKVDALRVSIGMEAFAQRDPLVQYKSEAAGMFKQLLSDIRAGVISKMFLFQPRRSGAAVEKTNALQSNPIAAQNTPLNTGSNKKKRKRH